MKGEDRGSYQRHTDHIVIPMDLMMNVNFGIHAQTHQYQGWSERDPKNDQQCRCIAGVWG